MASEGIPIIQGFFLEDIRKVHLQPWQRTGGLAARICLEGTGETNDAYVCEIPPGKALKPQRHLFEELIYIVSGRGATTVWNDPQSKHTFEWQDGSVFVTVERAPPPPAGDREAATRACAQEWYDWFEKKLHADPENWLFWLDKRWSRFLRETPPTAGPS